MDQRDLETIEREGRRIIALGRQSPDAPVPQYPVWNLGDLVVHVGGVHGRTAAICHTRSRERVATTRPPFDRDPFDWATEQLEMMLGRLGSSDPDAEVWTLVPSPALSFWCRRMVIETGVHRWDAEGAVGDPAPLLDRVATHGLDEFPQLYLPRLPSVPSLELVATDLGRRWRFTAGEREARIEGTASELFLRLMSRPGVRLPDAWAQAVDALASPAES